MVPTSEDFVSVLNRVGLSSILVQIAAFELAHYGFIVSCALLRHKHLKIASLAAFHCCRASNFSTFFFVSVLPGKAPQEVFPLDALLKLLQWGGMQHVSHREHSAGEAVRQFARQVETMGNIYAEES